jgi:HlyD family secretion protein
MDIKQKQDEYTKNEELHKKGFVTKTKLEELAFALEKARMTLEKNKLEQQILEAYERPKNEKQKAAAVDQSREELERERQRSESRQKQAEARVEEQKALLAMKETRYNRLKDQLAKCRIIAPNDGVVQYGGGDQGMFRFGGGNRIAAGEKVFEGQTLMSLPDTSQMIVTTRIHEADRHKVHEGLTCWVRVPAVPDKQFKGTISKIATFADSANRWLNPQLKEHSAEILLDETDAPVSPGDSAEIEIMIEQVPDVLAIPVQSVFSRGDQRFVFARRGISWEPVAVKLGRSNSQLIEVTDGLAAGDRVLMHATDDLLAKLPAIKVDHGAELPPPEVVAGAAREQKVEARTGEAHGAGSAQVRTEGPRQEGARREGGRGSGGRGPGGGGRSGGGPPGGSRGG